MHNKHLPGAWHISSQTQQTNIVWETMWQEWDPRVLVGTSQSREGSQLGSTPHCDPAPPRLVPHHSPSSHLECSFPASSAWLPSSLWTKHWRDPGLNLSASLLLLVCLVISTSLTALNHIYTPRALSGLSPAETLTLSSQTCWAAAEHLLCVQHFISSFLLSFFSLALNTS